MQRGREGEGRPSQASRIGAGGRERSDFQGEDDGSLGAKVRKDNYN